MTHEKLSCGLVGFFILQLLLYFGEGTQPPLQIDISDTNHSKDDPIYTAICPIENMSGPGCDTLLYFNKTDSNETTFYLKLDLLSDCNLIGALCNFQCKSGTLTTISFKRIAESFAPIHFKEKSYTVNIPESEKVGTTLYTFNQSMIERGDCDSYNVKVTFTVQTHKDIFEVKGEELRLKSMLDFEKKEQHNLTILANLYSKNDTTEFIINVIDVDDMDPWFIKPPYFLNITENDTSSLSGCHRTTPAVEAEDRDTGVGRQNLSYSLKQGSNGIFDIDNKTGCIQVKRLLHWSKDQPNMYHLVVQATQDNDPNRYATASLAVNVIDTNNHWPKFTREPYCASVDEHARHESYVMQVQANDDDEGPFGETRYKIIRNNGLFMIDNQTGVIRVDNSTGLDREAFPNISLQVEAIDVEANETGDVTTVEIILVDINDHTPQFTRDHYVFHIDSSDTVKVQATDNDTEGNGRISYTMIKDIPGVRINENNGTIYFTNIHAAETQFTVSACDNPVILGSRRCSFADVIAYLNGTTTETTVKNMYVTENSPVQTVVGSMDIQGATFSIVDQNIPFTIDRESLVRTTMVLDRENISTYIFTVTVTGKIIGNITVNVTVLDVNDNAPVFDKTEYIFGFPSGRSVIGRILATDEDLNENGNVSYNLQHSFVSNKYFAIDSRSGEITFSDVSIPTYESSFQLGVIATDHGDPPMQSFCSVYISRISVEGNFTVLIGTPLKEDVLRGMLTDLESKIGNILNLTISAQVSAAIQTRTTTAQSPRAMLAITATYKNGTKVTAKDLQREVLLHLSLIEALWASDVRPEHSTDNSNVSQIALIVVAGVMLLGTLIATIVLSIKWRQYKAQEKILRLHDNLTRRSSLYESQEIKVKPDDETSDYNGSLNTQDLETYDNGHRPIGELNAFQNPVYEGGDLDDTRVKAQAVNEALLSLNDLSNRLEEEDPLAPKPDYEKSELEKVSSLDEHGISELTDHVENGDFNAYDSADNVKNSNNNPYENIEFDDDFPVTSGFAGLKIDGKMISSTGEGHEDDVFIDDDDTDVKVSSDNDVPPEDEPDVDYHLKQVRFANRVVNADTNVAEELKPDKSELDKEIDQTVEDDNGDDGDDDAKVFLVNADSNNEYENIPDFQVNSTDASIRMDEEINSPVDFLKTTDESNAEDGEDTGTFVFGEEECTSL